MNKSDKEAIKRGTFPEVLGNAAHIDSRATELRKALAHAAIPLEVLYSTECDDKAIALSSDVKAEIKSAMIAVRTALAASPSDEIVDEVQRRMDAVVDAAVAWHQGGGDDWAREADNLENAIDSLLELRDKPVAASLRDEVDDNWHTHPCSGCDVTWDCEDTRCPGSLSRRESALRMSDVPRGNKRYQASRR